jgi:uncharacterized protein
LSASGLLAIFLVGVLGGTHCVGMCGGIVGALSAQVSVGSGRWRLHLGYNLGRIASYVLAGTLVGTVGGLSKVFASVANVQLALYVVANLMLVALGIYLMGFTRALAAVERLGQHLWRRLSPLSARLLPVRNLRQAVLLGVLWGWLPCGLVYSVLINAMVAGSPQQGALVMLVFGLGTLPNLLLAGILLARFRRFARAPATRILSGLIVLGFGLYGLLQALSFPI